MGIVELEEYDRRERERLHRKAIADTRRAIEKRRAAAAPTDALERWLVTLESM